jgi:hypothetical protein
VSEVSEFRQALSAVAAERDSLRRALGEIFETTNTALGHLTSQYIQENPEGRLLNHVCATAYKALNFAKEAND